jgi:hypothetical protein
MADHDSSPQYPLQDGTRNPQERTLDPYMSLVGAFLRQVVLDAQRPRKAPGQESEDDRGTIRHEAQAFLLDLDRLAPWVELTGADVDKMQAVLLRAAGLTRPPAARALGLSR